MEVLNFRCFTTGLPVPWHVMHGSESTMFAVLSIPAQADVHYEQSFGDPSFQQPVDSLNRLLRGPRTTEARLPPEVQGPLLEVVPERDGAQDRFLRLRRRLEN